MSRRRNSSDDGSFGVFLVGLIVVGLIIKYIWWILGAIAMVAAFYVARAAVRAAKVNRAAHAAHCAEIAARADRQHVWVLQGDARGTYGPEGLTAMRTVFGGKEVPPFGIPYDG